MRLELGFEIEGFVSQERIQDFLGEGVKKFQMPEVGEQVPFGLGFIEVVQEVRGEYPYDGIAEVAYYVQEED